VSVFGAEAGDSFGLVAGESGAVLMASTGAFSAGFIFIVLGNWVKFFS
jgi:hypothetical protein